MSWQRTACSGKQKIIGFSVSSLLYVTRAALMMVEGANIPGKQKQLRFFFGGMQAYRQKLSEVIKNGYEGFKPFTSEPTARL